MTDKTVTRTSHTISGDSEHVYISDECGTILSTHDTLEQAEASLRCACKGTQRLSTGTIDGETPEQLISCPWCASRPDVAPRPEEVT